MRRGDIIFWPKMLAHADGRRLLAGIEMDKARDAALRELLLHPLLEAADRDHVAIGADQLLAAQLHGVLPGIRCVASPYRIAPPNPRDAASARDTPMPAL